MEANDILDDLSILLPGSETLARSRGAAFARADGRRAQAFTMRSARRETSIDDIATESGTAERQRLFRPAAARIEAAGETAAREIFREALVVVPGMKAIRLLEFGSPLVEQEMEIPVAGPREVLDSRGGGGHLPFRRALPRRRFAAQIASAHAWSRDRGRGGGDRNGGAQFRRRRSRLRSLPRDLRALSLLPKRHRTILSRKARCSAIAAMAVTRSSSLVPERSLFHLPPEIPFEQGAILMCSSATSLHALHKARLRPGETVAIYGVGGLGISAVQLARSLGASRSFRGRYQPDETRRARNVSARCRSMLPPAIRSRRFAS